MSSTAKTHAAKLYVEDTLGVPSTDPEAQAYLNEPDECDDSHYESFGKRPGRGIPVQFPTGKPGRSSKDRRYVPVTKKSDLPKKEIRSCQGKGAKAKQNRKFLQDQP